MKKAISMLLVMGLSAGLLAGCGAKSVSGSEEATAENPMVLTLSHGLSETHTVHIAESKWKFFRTPSWEVRQNLWNN